MGFQTPNSKRSSPDLKLKLRNDDIGKRDYNKISCDKCARASRLKTK